MIKEKTLIWLQKFLELYLHCFENIVMAEMFLDEISKIIKAGPPFTDIQMKTAAGRSLYPEKKEKEVSINGQI